MVQQNPRTEAGMEAYSVLLPAGTPCSESQPTRRLDAYAHQLHCRASSLTVSIQMSMYAHGLSFGGTAIYMSDRISVSFSNVPRSVLSVMCLVPFGARGTSKFSCCRVRQGPQTAHCAGDAALKYLRGMYQLRPANSLHGSAVLSLFFELR